jgi:FlaA1/EpsC-like NDP-sugar epimerase
VLPPILHRFRRPIVLALHLALIPLGYLVAFVLRFDLPLPERYGLVFLSTLLFLLPIRLVSFGALRLFHGWWRHVGMQDLADLIKGVTLSSALFLGALFMTEQLAGFPRSILVLDWGVAVLLFGGARFAVRAIREARSGWSGLERRGTPALIIGAGEAAERLLRQIRLGGTGLRPIGLVDDDPTKQGMRMHGISVLGSTEDLGRLTELHDVKLLVIAIPSAAREEMRRIVDCCVATKVEFKIVPSLSELLDGRMRVSQLRKVQVEDLLGRDAIELDLGRVRDDLAGQTVLVTGAAGSIGSELVRQIAGFGPGRLILLEQAESPLYFVDLELRKNHPELDLVPVVCDVTDPTGIERVFDVQRPDFVFHAAAYKHVPLMEANIAEAVRNNVFGTLNVAECAARYGVQKFVLISTDKAVRPSSVMGATKRVAERIVLGWPALRDSGTEFRAVRFGNVLGSEGSVIPVFRKQLAQGGPLTVTDPDITRYFMTIPEAVQLVLQCASLPEAAGRIAMLEMGEPVRIVELAENLIRLSGLQPYKDVPIVFTGLRPGEKLFEELMSDVEATVPTALEKIRIVQTDEADGRGVERAVDRLATAVATGSHGDLLVGLCAMVPECVAPLRESGTKEMRSRVGEREHSALFQHVPPPAG